MSLKKDKITSATIYQSHFKNDHSSVYLTALSFNGYIIATILENNIYYFYIQNQKEDILVSKAEESPKMIIEVEESKTEKIAQNLLFHFPKEIHPVFKKLQEVVKNKTHISKQIYFPDEDDEPLQLDPDMEYLTVCDIKLINPDKPEFTFKLYEGENFQLKGHTDLGKLAFDDVFFSEILNKFYSTVDLTNSLSFDFRNYNPNIPQENIKTLLEIENYREKIEVPEGENIALFIDNVRAKRTPEKNAKLKPNYTQALLDAQKTIDKVIQSEQEFSLPQTANLNKIQAVRQDSFTQIENALMIKTNFSKIPFTLHPKDFNENGIAKKELNYKACGQKVHADLWVSSPITEELNDILLFPIDTDFFKPVGRPILTAYDGKVFKAICTLLDVCLENNPNQTNPKASIEIPVTLSDIHHAMGYPDKRLSQQEAEKIKFSMFKLSTTKIGYDWSQEREARHINVNEAINVWGESVMYKQIAQYMLEAEESLITPFNSKLDKNGNPLSVEGYIIKAYPPIYVHAKLTRKIASVPLKWFKLKGIGRMSDRKNSLMQGLTEKISTAQYYQKQGKNPNVGNYNDIVFNEFFHDNGIIVKNKQTKSALIKEIKNLLEVFKTEGIIKKFDISNKEGRPYKVKFII